MSSYYEDRLAWKGLDGVWHYSHDLANVPVFKAEVEDWINKHEKQIIQAHGIPPAGRASPSIHSFGGGGEYASEPNAVMDGPFHPVPGTNVVHYNPSAAEAATFRQPGDLSREEVDELRKQLTKALHERQALWSIAEDAIKSASNTRTKWDAENRLKRMELGLLPKEVRIGDRVRNRYIDHLSNMLADGVLTQDEFSERMDKAATAQYERDLKELIADLPALPSPFRGEPVVLNEHKPSFLQSWKVSALIWAVAITAWLCVFLLVLLGGH